MILKNSDYQLLSEKIKKENKRIIIYGAGMMGQVIIPYLIEEYQLVEYVECFVDADIRKKDKEIYFFGKKYRIKSPDYLEDIDEKNVILISNSKFFQIINFLDGISNLDNIEGYIVPIMQIYELQKNKSIEIIRRKEEKLIEKKIHYCWFGKSELPKFLNECIETWKKYCPDYEIIEWNEENYNVNRHIYTKEAYENKKFGFVSDFARLDILYENGGIYLDTDVSLEKNLDELLYQEGFIGTEKWGNINSGGGCGFVKYHPMLKKMIDYREQFHFVLKDGTLNMETCGLYETKLFLEYGFKPNNRLQFINNVTIYPSYVNHPYDYMSCELQKKEATISVHHFYGSWMEKDDCLNRKNTQEQYQKIKKRMFT